MPEGKFSNLIGYLKHLNLLRVCNCDIDMDDSTTVADLIASLKKIICNDAEFAAKTLRDLGAIQEIHTVKVHTGVNMRWTKQLGDKDGFILSSTDMGVKPFLNIHGVTEGPDTILSANLMKGLVTVALMSLCLLPFQRSRRRLRCAQCTAIQFQRTT